MIECEELRNDIDRYLTEHLYTLTIDDVITTRRDSRIDLYLHIRKVKSLFPTNCLIIARNQLSSRTYRTWYFIQFLTEIAFKHNFKHIRIESVYEKSWTHAEKLDFHSIDGFNHVISVENLIDYFLMV